MGIKSILWILAILREGAWCHGACDSTFGLLPVLQTGTWFYIVTSTIQQTIVVSATSKAQDPNDTLIAVNTFWSKDKYPHLLPYDPQTIIAMISKGKDKSS